MTKLLEQAIEQLRSLPEQDQDAVAGLVLHELEEIRRWEETSVKHAVKLQELADEALEDFRAGRTVELDPDQL